MQFALLQSRLGLFDVQLSAYRADHDRAGSAGIPIAETAAYQRDLPKAEVRILEAGHFALYEQPDDVSDFLRRTPLARRQRSNTAICFRSSS